MNKKDFAKESEKIASILATLNQLEIDTPEKEEKAIRLYITEGDGFLIEKYDGAEYPIGYLMNLAIQQIASIMIKENTDYDSILQKNRKNIEGDLLECISSHETVDIKEIDFYKIIFALDYCYKEKRGMDPVLYKTVFTSPLYFEHKSRVFFYTSSPFDRESVNRAITKNSLSEYKKYIQESFSKEFEVLATCYSLMEIVFSTLEAIAYKGKQINKCELCGKYYVPQGRTDEKYCDFENPDYPGKTCKEAIKLIKIKERTKEDETKHLAKRIYNRLYRRQENNPDDTKARRDLFDFTSSNDEWKSNMASGGKTKTEYLHWLRERNKFYTKKKKKVK